MAGKINAEMRSKFLEIETNIKSVYTRFSTSLMNDAISKRVKQEREYEDECIEDEEEKDTSTQFFRIQKIHLIELMQHLESYTNTLSVFGFLSTTKIMNTY